MTFAIENPQVPSALIDSIANKMIGISGGHWTDADPEFTTAGNPKGRALKYENGSEVLYLTIVVARIGGTSTGYYRTTQEGVLFFISDAWDSVNHAPSGNVQRMMVPIVGTTGISALTAPADNTQADLYIWWEDDILTFLLRNTGTSSYDYVGLFVMERDADKEYDDGQGKFFFFTECQTTNSYGGYEFGSSGGLCKYGEAPVNWSLPNTIPWNALKGRMAKYAHPFTVAYPSSFNISIDASGTTDDFTDGGDQTRHMAIIPSRATRSEATNRVYYSFPIVHGDSLETFRSPIKTFKSFFPVQPNKGLIDGDLINVPVEFNGQPVKTWQYMYKAMSNPDGGSGLNVAIKYAEP